MLGTTFGGNHLGCAAAVSVLEIIEDENLLKKSAENGLYMMEKLKTFSEIKAIRGLGLMIAIDFEIPASQVSKKLREDYKILTGSASNPKTMRLLPPLTISKEEIDQFVMALEKTFAQIAVTQ